MFREGRTCWWLGCWLISWTSKSKGCFKKLYIRKLHLYHFNLMFTPKLFNWITPCCCQDPEDGSADVDDLSEGDFSEEELGSLAVNLGSLHQQQAGPGQGSDTEGDFLDKCDVKNKIQSLNRALEDEFKSSIGDDERSVCSDLERRRDNTTIKVR